MNDRRRRQESRGEDRPINQAHAIWTRAGTRSHDRVRGEHEHARLGAAHVEVQLSRAFRSGDAPETRLRADGRTENSSKKRTRLAVPSAGPVATASNGYFSYRSATRAGKRENVRGRTPAT